MASVHSLIALAVITVLVAAPGPHSTQQTPAAAPNPQRELLERLTGRWVMRGTISGRQTTHDIDAQWVLEKEYVQIHEVSREKGPDGKPQYEAIIYVVWEPKAGEFACLWMDTTGIANFPPEGVGHAKPSGDRIAFIFKDPAGSVHTTFAYDRVKNAWTWTIDNEAKGALTPFARLALTRE
jgi:hypothetical protein